LAYVTIGYRGYLLGADKMDKMPEVELTARSLYHALSSALRELAMRDAMASESYIVGRKELEEAREKLGIKRF
jgi:hypothetical protein